MSPLSPGDEHGRPDYAVVAVNAGGAAPGRSREIDPEDDQDEERPLDAFHYEIPLALEGISPGHLVWVPFGPQYVQGVVMALADASPVEETRPIDRLADPNPMLNATQLELARWISEYYLTPLPQAIWAMIPPGTTEQAEAQWEAVAEAPAEAEASLTPGQRQVLEVIRTRGPLPAAQIGEHVEPKTWRAMLKSLEQAGLVSRHMVITSPRVRPLMRDFYRLPPGALPTQEQVTNERRMALVATLVDWANERPDTHGWMIWDDLADASGATRADVRWLLSRELLETEKRQVWRDPLAGQEFVAVTPPRLTGDQEGIWRRLQEDLENRRGGAFLLQGVTGSGKTELYLRAAQSVLAQGRGAIILVPEIALTPQTVRRFGARFPDTIAVMHSGLTPGERFDQWRRLRAGELRLVVGARSAILSPVQNLGLIVLDEEHEWTYRQDNAPVYHAREVALELSRLTGAAVILGSATPSLEASYLAERGVLTRLSLPKRVMGHRRAIEQQMARVSGAQAGYVPIANGDDDALYAELPPVQIVDLRQELCEGNRSILSRALQQGLAAALAAHQQAILFVNRRGSASFVVCRDCGYVLTCRRCDLPYTYHSAGEDLVCHRCNSRMPVPEVCPRCASRRIRYFGLGTQRVEDEVRALYPDARVVRWDYDATRARGAHEQLLDRFVRGEADVMVGTQMVAKGLDLPLVTLVGVISADTLLNLPELRASERTFQVLTQVAGRAGRSILGGRAIVQTYAPEHPAIVAASQHDYEGFYRQEIAFRRAHWYPPLSRMIRLLYTDSDARRAESAASELYALLTERIARLGLPDVDLIGPSPAFYGRLRGSWRWHLLVRGADPAVLLQGVLLSPGWRIQVDPLSLL